MMEGFTSSGDTQSQETACPQARGFFIYKEVADTILQSIFCTDSLQYYGYFNLIHGYWTPQETHWLAFSIRVHIFGICVQCGHYYIGLITLWLSSLHLTVYSVYPRYFQNHISWVFTSHQSFERAGKFTVGFAWIGSYNSSHGPSDVISINVPPVSL